MTALRIGVWTLAFSPLAWFVAFWLFVLRARAVLGFWPTPYHPDPKDLGFDLHYLAVVIGLPWALAATLVLLLLIAFNYRQIKSAGARPVLAGITGVMGLALSLGIGRQDPGRFFYWFAD
jgi:hypothetical protein